MLSVPALFSKVIGALFQPGKPLYIDSSGDMNALGTGKQDEVGLFYISDSQNSAPNAHEMENAEAKMMISIASEHLKDKKTALQQHVQ